MPKKLGAFLRLNESSPYELGKAPAEINTFRTKYITRSHKEPDKSNNQPERVNLEASLFTAEQLKQAMKLDKIITDYHESIYLSGIEIQAAGDTVSTAQAKAINITHKKIDRIFNHPSVVEALEVKERERAIKAQKEAIEQVAAGRAQAATLADFTPQAVPVASRIDAHLGNLIAEMEALRSLLKEMQ